MKYHTRVQKEIADRLAAEGEEATQDALKWSVLKLRSGGHYAAADWLAEQIASVDDTNPPSKG